MVKSEQIVSLDAWQVLDSRGRPTVAVQVVLGEGARGTASVPSGASTGSHEVRELRDRLPEWHGLGVTRAVDNVRGTIASVLRGKDAGDLPGIDDVLIDLDGTELLTNLGANAVLATSIACATAVANARQCELWELWTQSPLLPMPMVNIISGGAHADRAIDIQDFLVVPIGATTFSQAIEWAARVRHSTALRFDELGFASSLVADEGGLAAPFSRNRDALETIMWGIRDAGLRPGIDVSIALDVAATQLMDEGGQYLLRREDRTFSAPEWIDEMSRWCSDFPIVSVEDVLGEDDWEHWAAAGRALSGIQLIGDDLFVTQRDRLDRGISSSVANAILVKPNQNGTLSGSRDVLELAKTAGYATVVSARSGETEDHWLADLAVGWRAGQIKVGSTMRSERTAKWNRLLAIERRHPQAEFAGWS